MRRQCPADAGEAVLRGFSQGVLPDADDFPSLTTKLAVHASVAANVVFALFVPEPPIGFGAFVALGARVPETSIHEDGDLLLWKRKIGLSDDGDMSSPTRNLVAS